MHTDRTSELDALRAERDRLVTELAAALAARDALERRVTILQRALSRPAPAGIAERALGRAMGALARARGPRVSSAR